MDSFLSDVTKMNARCRADTTYHTFSLQMTDAGAEIFCGITHNASSLSEVVGVKLDQVPEAFGAAHRAVRT
jgi:hypothetical protein